MTTAIESHFRSFRPELEVRSTGDGRTIFGIAVPYRAPTRITADLIEEFLPGAFDHQMRNPNRVKVFREHHALGGTLIGALANMRDDPLGLYVEMRVSRTPKGEETLELVRDGALNELSIGFSPRQNRQAPGGILQRIKADLSEVAIVMAGAYAELATAAGVRSAAPFAEPPMVLGADDVDLRRRAEEFLRLPDPTDNDLKVRQLRLGMPI